MSEGDLHQVMIRIILLMGLLSQVVVAQETDFSSIETNWRVCATCHGNNGEGKPGFPSLNKLTSEYVIEALSDYRDSVYRGDQSAIMFGMAAALTDEQIELLGKYAEEVLNDD